MWRTLFIVTFSSMTTPLAQPYVLAWRLAGLKVVVIGGGSIGTAKVETLLSARARLIVVDPEPSIRIQQLANSGHLELRTRFARPTDVWGATLVVAATGNTGTNRRVRRWSKAVRGVVNAVDDVENCDVTVPAVIQRGPATIAITTGGASPAAARFLREELTAIISAAIPADTSALISEASAARSTLRHNGTYRYDYAAWRQRFFEPGLQAIRRGRPGAIAEIRKCFEVEFAHGTPPLRPGHVTLVGAGPGGADLITVRGAAALADADVVIYDRLVEPNVLHLSPVAAERIPVGKGRGFGPNQGQINDLIAAKAAAGNHVVRLKGGDPFVFGRGSEEVDMLNALGLVVEVVPGVSSALAAPTLAGIPLTDRRLASSFTVLTGHCAIDNRHNWSALAASQSTLVVLMGVTTARLVAEKLTDAGRPFDEPVAFVHAAATPDQDTAYRTLAEVAANGCPFPSPTVMVIGPVAAYRPTTPGTVPGSLHALMPS